VELSEAALWEPLDEWVLDELPLEGMMDVLDVLAEALKEMPALRDLSRLFRAFASKLTKYWQTYEKIKLRRTYLTVHNVIGQNPIPRQTMSRGSEMRGFSMEKLYFELFRNKTLFAWKDRVFGL
jgi:hypothetical protein